MLKRVITIVTLISFMFHIAGCYTSEAIPIFQMDKYRDEVFNIKSIETFEGKLYEFTSTEWHPSAKMIDSLIVGWIKEYSPNGLRLHEIKIPLSKIKTLNVEKFDAGNTCLFSVGSFAIVGIILLIKVFSSPWGN